MWMFRCCHTCVVANTANAEAHSDSDSDASTWTSDSECVRLAKE